MNKKIFNKYASLALAALTTGVMTTACTDWDDHYATDSQVVPTATKTIWQNMEERDDLSQFRTLISKVGMDTVLNKINSYTVWAPLNGTFNYDSICEMNDAKLLKQFVQNHIAQYSHSASGVVEKRIPFLNEKTKTFAGAGSSYSIAGVPISVTNIACNNGFLHLTDGQIHYYANIYESLNKELSALYGVDSICDYFMKNHYRELDLSQSTEGPTVNGERTYLDSVYYEYNPLFGRYNALINVEDSSYAMLLPTNEAWTNIKAQIMECYNYVPSIKFLDGSTSDVSADRTKNTKSTTELNASLLRDSIAEMLIMSNLYYNSNLSYNRSLKEFQNGSSYITDSLMNTQRLKIYGEETTQLFEGAKRIDASNGSMFVVDELRIHPWRLWNPIIRIEGENATISYQDKITRAGRERIGYGQQNPAVQGKVSGDAFLNITARAHSNPKIDIRLPNVRSTEYNIYVVLLPNNINNVLDTIPQKNSLQFVIGCNDESGNLAQWGFDEDDNTLVSIKANKLASFFGYVAENDPTKVDTVHVGTFKFPIAYAGYANEGDIYPYLRIEDCTEKWTGKNTSDIRLDCILLVPTELEAYLKENPEYKLD